MDVSYLSFEKDETPVGGTLGSVYRELDLAGEALAAIPKKFQEAVVNNPEKLCLEMATAGGLSFGMAYYRGRTGALATVVRGIGVGVGVATVVDLGKNLIPVSIAASQAWQSADNFEENKRVAREHFAPFCLDLALTGTAALGGGYLGGRMYRASQASKLLEQTQCGTSKGENSLLLKPGEISPSAMAISAAEKPILAAETPAPSAKMAAAPEPASATGLHKLTETSIRLPPEIAHLEPGLNDIKAGNINSTNADRVLLVLERHFGQPPTPQTEAIFGALRESKITWSQFDQVIYGTQKHFGWPAVEALPIVRELNATYPGLHRHIALASKYKPETWEPIRDIYHSATPEDQVKIIQYLKAQYGLQIRGRDPTMLAFCDKYPVYEDLVKEFSALRAARKP